MIYSLSGKKPQIAENVFIAPNASIIGDVLIKELSSVWFSATIRGDINSITIGRGTSIQDGVVIHVDAKYPTVIGDDVTIGHQAVVHGCTIGNRVIIGMSATVMDGAEIGENSIVGGGTVVPEGKKFPHGVLILGVPGKVVRELKPEEIDRITYSARVYQERTLEYLRSLKSIE
ncbi:gamma carbonic anhydrase family protein [Thermoflavimicrobium dichotomicum]|uniref:Carbonic anhydrase or acetyltransferase, isoleucine patch superfamily n=1 Tax=Thermoflavimicrobium dichotomicum TaxID=46223 RepID=A0A1I3UFL1_9BACL|nr:gamma carbonic anhydrase family protein [Thermoflavimicrobium dichotomicum]SFJ81665.1 Carbonic anhydrase or acetyltransferase, isoleucine patch superfamily [Thermoflavimicrobium dichotomicum]